MRILHRYILKEMLKALALTLVAASGVVCFAMVLSALQQHGLGPLRSLLYMTLSFPGAVYLALPLSAILAGTLIYGRLAADNEVMACRASGIPVSSLFWPTVLLACLAAAVALGLAAWPLSESGYAAKRLALADIEQWFFSQLSDGSINIKEANFQLSVDRVVGDLLYGPMVKHRGRNGQTYCYAPYGRVEFDQENKQLNLALWDALIVDELHASPVRGTHKVGVTLPADVPRRADDLSLWCLLAYTRHPEWSDQIRALPEGGSEQAIQNEKNKARATFIGEMHGRLAVALGCFGLVLIGAGLGMYFHSGHILTAFGVAMVPWLVSTFLTLAAVKAVSRAAAHAPAMVWIVWTPNVVVLLLGIAVLTYMSWFWSSPVRLKDLFRGPRQ